MKQSDIDTSRNVAYSKSSGFLLKKVDVDTKDNVAYSGTDEVTLKQAKLKLRIMLLMAYILLARVHHLFFIP